MKATGSEQSRLWRMSERLDAVVGVVSPTLACKRKQHRFAYDILDGTRLRRKRSGLTGTGDQQLTESDLGDLRDIARDLCRNNPLAKGLLKTEAAQVVGTRTLIQARTDDEGWNEAAETLFREEMIERPCDITGRLAFHPLVKKLYHHYRRDGDAFLLFTDDGPQACEGDWCGTPLSWQPAELFDVTAGVATAKKSGRVVGYFIGKPDKWGLISDTAYKKYLARDVHHVFNPEQFSNTRGEPALTSAVNFIDRLTDYTDAELVAAKVNACLALWVTTTDEYGLPSAYTKGVSSSGEDADGSKLQKIEPGMVWYGGPGEDAKPILPARPTQAFDPFVTRMMMFIGRPLCLPLMLVTLDYSGATYMNARIAYQEARAHWEDEQNEVVVPLVRRIWRWFIDRAIAEKKLTARADQYRAEIKPKRWPYIDPFKEAQGDKQQLENGTTTRSQIIARQGGDFKDLIDERKRELDYETKVLGDRASAAKGKDDETDKETDDDEDE